MMFVLIMQMKLWLTVSLTEGYISSDPLKYL